jgi:uncharacterized protein (DUF1697 family)
MTTFISILRGINVSGQKLIRMTELKALYEDLNFSSVRTHIQSGNVIFNYDQDIHIKELSGKIEDAILKKFGFHVPVIIRTMDELRAIILANPFQKSSGYIPEKLYITFLEEKPQLANIEKINQFDFLPDKFIIIEREIYLNCAAGYGTTKLSNTFFENKLKVRATTRNWNTVNKLLELATYSGN